ncbi:hypothetical protein ANN_06451 [Periplaneta americana]|uniref:Uncharacterized protein n=1 Tax=Periplaneta americana TaxID=6978 RepID=A0ABQ8TDR2_PERAM|nr:hypothetical protein ANN_06451 [Periplaneta americana]
MGGLCESGNEPAGSLKAISVGLKPDGVWRVLGINTFDLITPFDLITWLGFSEVFPTEKANAGKESVISLWGIIKQHVSKHRYQTIEDLKQAVREAFREIKPPLLRKISHRTWRRIILCRDSDDYLPKSNWALFLHLWNLVVPPLVAITAATLSSMLGTQLNNGSWPHVSAATMQWYADNNVRRLDWPTQSPDLNPIEYLWVELDRRLRTREMRPSSIVQMNAMLQEEWRRIPVYILHKLVEIMPDRVAAVIATRGGDKTFGPYCRSNGHYSDIEELLKSLIDRIV